MPQVVITIVDDLDTGGVKIKMDFDPALPQTRMPMDQLTYAQRIALAWEAQIQSAMDRSQE